MTKNLEIRNGTTEFLIFTLEGKEDGIQVMYKNETILATQKAMAQFFDCSTVNIVLFPADTRSVNPVIPVHFGRDLDMTFQS